ncbi:hypothetical protein Ndes2437B_g02155 [Nannochloris sp. 'desiccata']
MSDDEVVLLRPDKNQRTLLSLSKVVRLDNTSMCFTLEEIRTMKAELLVASQTKHELLIILRKLDCYNLQVEDLRNTDIGSAVSTLAQRHPKPDVAQLASRILAKWRDLVETSLFKSVEYDVEAAGVAEDGEAVAPEDLIAAEKEQQRLEKLERRRLRIEEDFMAVSSSDEEMSEGPSQDPEWAPITQKKSQQSQQAPPKNPVSLRRSRSGRAAAAERFEKEKAEKEAAAAAAAGEMEEVVVEDGAEAISIEANVDNESKDDVEIIEKEGEEDLIISSDGPVATAKESALPTVGAAPTAPAANENEIEATAPESAAPAVKKIPKPRLTILAMLQKQAAAVQAQAATS